MNAAAPRLEVFWRTENRRGGGLGGPIKEHRRVLTELRALALVDKLQADGNAFDIRVRPE